MGKATSDTPLLLRVGKVVSFTAGTLFVVVALAASFGLADTSSLDRAAFGDWTVPLWSVAMYVVGVLFLAIGVGLKAQRAWVRPLIIGFWASLALGNIIWFATQISRRQVASGDFTSIPFLLFAAWYLYAKRNVVEYFQQLKARQA